MVRAVVGEYEGDIDSLVVGLESKIVWCAVTSALIFYAMRAARLFKEETVCAHRIRTLWPRSVQGTIRQLNGELMNVLTWEQTEDDIRRDIADGDGSTGWGGEMGSGRGGSSGDEHGGAEHIRMRSIVHTALSQIWQVLYWAPDGPTFRRLTRRAARRGSVFGKQRAVLAAVRMLSARCPPVFPPVARSSRRVPSSRLPPFAPAARTAHH